MYQERVSLYRDEWAPVISDILSTARYVGYMANAQERQEMSDALTMLAGYRQFGPDTPPEMIEKATGNLREWVAEETNPIRKSLGELTLLGLSQNLQVSQGRQDFLDSLQRLNVEYTAGINRAVKSGDFSKFTSEFPSLIQDLSKLSLEYYDELGAEALALQKLTSSTWAANLNAVMQPKREIRQDVFGIERYVDTEKAVFPEVERKFFEAEQGKAIQDLADETEATVQEIMKILETPPYIIERRDPRLKRGGELPYWRNKAGKFIRVTEEEYKEMEEFNLLRESYLQYLRNKLEPPRENAPWLR